MTQVASKGRVVVRVEALGFRCLQYVAQDIAPFQVLVGPNGAGKSTFLDVVGFLGDLLRVGPLRAIHGDSKNSVPMRSVDPLHLCWLRKGGRFELAVELAIPEERSARFADQKYGRARYEVAVRVGQGEVSLAAETLWLAPERAAPPGDRQRSLFPEPMAGPDTILTRAPKKRVPAGWRKVVSRVSDESANAYFRAETSDWSNPFRLGPDKSALANLPEDEDRFPVATWVKRTLLEGVDRVVLNAEAMRRASPPGAPARYLPDGSNLPWVVESLKKQAKSNFNRWVEHVRTALPEIASISTKQRPEDRHRYLIVKFTNGLQAPSWSLSDGTLRLLALTLLAYVPSSSGIYLIEEPENGIHPRAVETIFQSLSSVYDSQILCASHSPVVLSLARPEDLLCFAKSDAGATAVVLGSEHPRLREWRTSDLGTLFASGVLG